jgi:alpha-tubulin suppressor-like RCC1 family protein
VTCWGDNKYGQLGIGSTDTVAHGFPLTTNQTFVSVSVGSYHSCGVFDSNAPVVYCWGFNGTGQLAIDSTGTVYPTLHVVSAGYHLVAAGGAHTCAVDANFAVHCAGDNFYGELGAGNYNTPVYLLIPTVPSQQADSLYSGYAHSCSLRSNVATCWGFDSAGALGIGQMNDSVATPTAVAGGLKFASLGLSPAGYHTCGITTSGAAYCWGYGFYGQIGNGTTSNQSTPTPVIGTPAAPGLSPSRIVARPPTARRPARK